MGAAPDVMQDADYKQFESSLRAAFALYGGRKVGSDTVGYYWGYLQGKMPLKALPRALSDACAESLQFVPSAMLIAECASRARSKELREQQSLEVLGRKQLAGRSDDARHAHNIREITKLTAIIGGKLSA